MDIHASTERLNSLLPLKARQDGLPLSLQRLHQQILFSLVELGRAPTSEEMVEVLGEKNIQEGLQRLGAADLIVLDRADKFPVGAYPVTLENTPHKIHVNGHTIHAMCALDALSVAPMFDAEVVIDSVCHVTQAPIHLCMQGVHIVDAQPSTNITVGIRWQNPSIVAAHSLCMEMIFLKDRKTAEAWQHGDVDNISLYDLPEAVAFGKAFFLPLLEIK